MPIRHHLVHRLERTHDTSLLANFKLMFDYYQHALASTHTASGSSVASAVPADGLIEYSHLVLLKARLDAMFSQKEITEQLQVPAADTHAYTYTRTHQGEPMFNEYDYCDIHNAQTHAPSARKTPYSYYHFSFASIHRLISAGSPRACAVG